MTHPILRHQVPTGVAAATVTVRSPRFDADDAAAPVYTVKVPTRRDRIEFQASLTEAGLRWPSDAEIFECVRADLRANVSDWKALVAALDSYEEQAAEASRRNQLVAFDLLAADTDEARQAVLDAAREAANEHPPIEPDVAAQYAAIEADMRQNCPAFRRLEADRRRYSSLMPLVTTAMFLLGWAGIEGEFRRESGRVPEEVLELLPEPDLQAVHQKVMELMGVAAAAAKNSGSPSASSSGRRNSTSAGKPRTARTGKSTATSTRSTRATKSTKAG